MPNKKRRQKLKDKLLQKNLGIKKKPEHIKMTLKKLIEKSKIELAKDGETVIDRDVDDDDVEEEMVKEEPVYEQPPKKSQAVKGKVEVKVDKKIKKNKYFFLAHPEYKEKVDLDEYGKTFVVEKEKVEMKKELLAKPVANKVNKKAKLEKNLSADSEGYTSIWQIEPYDSSSSDDVVDEKKAKKRKLDKIKMNKKVDKVSKLVFEKKIEKMPDGSMVESYSVVEDKPVEVEEVSVNEEKMLPNEEVKSEGVQSEAQMKLQSSRFRYLNELLYTKPSDNSFDFFKSDPDSFVAYHRGFQSQTQKWPVNPLNKIIDFIKSQSSNLVIADFGCGEGKLAQSVNQKVHSFDFVSLNSQVIQCDMKNVPLNSNSCDVTVFCLSLMGTNLSEFICEAHRVLKLNGIMKIAEVASRFENINLFIKNIEAIGFKCISKDIKTGDYFYYFDFKKISDQVKNKNVLIKLEPCLYKKR